MPTEIRETAATLTAATPGKIKVGLITPGLGSSGYYSAEVLKSAADRKVWPKGTHVFFDHPSESEMKDRPERSVRDLAAVFSEDAHWVDGVGLVAEATVIGAYRELVTDPVFAEGVGMSIRAYAQKRIGEVDGQQVAIVTSLDEGLSVDLVTKAGRGGRILDVLESARQSAAVEATASDVREQIEQAIAAAFSGDGIRTYVLDYDPDANVVWFAIYDEQGDARTLYQVGYEQGRDTVTLANEQPVEVRRTTTYVPVTQPPALEADPSSDEQHTPPPSVPAPAGQSTAKESKETHMATIQIEEAELGQLRADSERVRSLESERDTAASELAIFKAREAARPSVTAKVAEANLPAGRKTRIVDAVLAGITADTDAEQVAAATEAAVKDAEVELAELAEHLGAGKVTGFGNTTSTATESKLTVADLDRALGLTKEN